MKLTSMEISDVTRREAWKDRSNVKQTSVDAALVSGHPRDAKKMSVTGAGRLREWFSYAATRGAGDRWPLTGACPANNKYRIVTGRG